MQRVCFEEKLAMASIYDAAGQAFGRFGSGGETWPRGKQTVARLSQFFFYLASEQLSSKPSPPKTTQNYYRVR